MVPIQSILGKLPLVLMGDTGTIVFKLSARFLPKPDVLAKEFYPRAYCDTAKGFDFLSDRFSSFLCLSYKSFCMIST